MVFCKTKNSIWINMHFLSTPRFFTLKKVHLIVWAAFSHINYKYFQILSNTFIIDITVIFIIDNTRAQDNRH